MSTHNGQEPTFSKYVNTTGHISNYNKAFLVMKVSVNLNY